MSRPTDPNKPLAKRNFRRVSQGDLFYSAAEFNSLTSSVSEQSRSQFGSDAEWARIQLFELDEPLGVDRESSSEFRFRDGTPLYFDRDSGLWKKQTNAQPQLVTSPYRGLVWDQGERIEARWDAQLGSYTPLTGTVIRPAITCREDPDSINYYPGRDDNANVFPIKFIRLPYDLDYGAGAQAVNHELIDASTTDEDDYCLNLYDGESGDDCPCSTNYIPEGTIIWVFWCNGYWYTHTCCPHEESSSSGSSESSSSGSSESSSESSQSPSSQSETSQSTSQSSISHSESSFSDSSISVSFSSLSSISRSESSESQSSESESVSSESQSELSSQSDSISDSQSSERDCVTVVTSLMFDGDTCILTYCTRQICFPAGLGITIGDESC